MYDAAVRVGWNRRQYTPLELEQQKKRRRWLYDWADRAGAPRAGAVNFGAGNDRGWEGKGRRKVI